MSELKVVFADYPHSTPVKNGEIKDDNLTLKFTEFKKISAAFDDMVETQPYDVCEMAIATLFQALDFNKPLRLLPIVMDGQFHHGSLFYNPEYGVVTPEDLKGSKMAVRAYSQTTGVWVRGALSEQYGIKPCDVTFITSEDPHVAEYVNPPYVQRAPESVKSPLELVDSGECKTFLGGAKQLEGREWKRVIPNHEEAEKAWGEAHGAVPINHMLCCSEEILERDPEAVKTLFSLLKQGVEKATADGTIKPAVRIGREAVWPTVKTCLEYCLEQGLISRMFTEDEVFAPGIDV